MTRVLFNIREDYLSNPGGDTIQLLKTAEALRSLKVETDIANEVRPDLNHYDVVHLFNLTRVRETLSQCENARKFNIPVALSTIYWNMDEFYRQGLNNPFKRIYHRTTRNSEVKLKFKKIAALLLRRKFHSTENMKARMGFKAQQNYIVDSADILLPNSEVEMECLRTDLEIEKNYVVVPNAVDSRFRNGSHEEFTQNYHQHCLEKDKFVLCVSRIEDRKNILKLIQAVSNTDLTLVIIGGINPTQKKYYEKCRKASGRNVIFIGQMSHHELISAYAAARVHVLPSWYETPGLSSLEAGLAGCNIVTTDRGSTMEYFKDYAEYCDPSSVISIRTALLKAYEKPKSRQLSQHIFERYTWTAAAQQTLKAYKKIL
jgi:glycosyltransferase involved in cell wall biosynthesis